MADYYCHSCAAQRGLLNPPPTGPVVGSTYQLAKYIKHTQPTARYPVQSVFDAPSTQAYRDHILNALAAGSVEVDDAGRVNVVWAAGQQTGFLFAHGVLVQPQDAVKVVLSSNAARVHAYSANSTTFTFERCCECGGVAVV